MATREDILKGLGNPQQLQAEHEANQAREAEQRSYEEGVKQGVAAVPRAQRKREMNGSSSQASEVPPDNSAEINQRHDSYRDWLDRMYNVESPEQVRKRERRDRARRIISAVGDGITSIANMYFANNGGIPLVKPQLGQTLNKRLQEERAYREANRDRYVNAYMRNEANRRSELRDDNLSRWRATQAKNVAEETARKAANDAERAKQNEWMRQFKTGELDLKREALDLKREIETGKLDDQKRRTRVAELNAKINFLRANGYETEITEVDEYGNVKTVTRKTTPNSGLDNNGSIAQSPGGQNNDQKRPLPTGKKRLP